MLSVTRAFLVFFLLLVCLSTLSTCRGMSEFAPSSAADTITEAEQPGFAALLAPPSAYVPMLAPPRRAAYAEEDLIKHGADYVAGLPYPNASVDGDCLVFDPNWSQATGMGVENLSYCFYSFAVPGFDRTPQIRCGWREPPEDFSTVWIGQADWQQDAWRWYQAEEDDVIEVASIGDNELLVIVHASAKPSALGGIGLGPKQLTAEFEVTPERAWAPGQLQAAMTGSAATVGSIVKYEVDWDGDWVFEADYGTESVGYQEVAAAGDYTAAGRITSSYYETATAMDTYTVLESWQHTWGLDANQMLYAVCTDGGDFCYAAGVTNHDQYGAQILLLKYSLAGEFHWAHSWGAPAFYPDVTDDIQLYDDKIFLTGYSTAYGAGGHDVLVQCWNVNGDVQWTRTWGRHGDECGEGLAVTDTHIYVCVNDPIDADDEYALLLKYDHSGNLQWVKGLQLEHPTIAKDLVMTYDGLLDEYRLHVTGVTTDLVDNVFYAQFDEAGNLLDQKVWSTSTDVRGDAITAFGNPPNVYITGSKGIKTGHTFAGVLVELSYGTAGTSIEWTDGEFTAFTPADLTYRDGCLLICGHTDVFGQPDAEGGFLASISPLGEAIGGRIWRGGHDCRLTKLIAVPDRGQLLVGSCYKVITNAWELWPIEYSTYYGPIEGTWSDLTGTLVSLTGTTTSPEEAVVTENGVHDIGGGSVDAAIMTFGMP